MHKRIFTLLSLAVTGFGFSFTACGGSSSETPPPLEPDPRGNNYLGNYRASSLDDADAGTTDKPKRMVGGSAEAPSPSSPQSPARSTWGSGRGASPRAGAPAPLK